MSNSRVTLQIGGPLTPMVKKIMIINGSIFLLQQFVGLLDPVYLQNLFGLSHSGLVENYHVWQVFTYMFFHGGWFHIIFNLLALWMFAGELEQAWGSRFFLRYYLYSGLGAGIFIAGMNALVYFRFGASPVTLGASGAIYAILLAYGLRWPNREVLLWFVLPVKMKYLLIVYGLIEFFGTLSNAMGQGGTISHIGHLGGLVTGFLYLLFIAKNNVKGNDEGLIESLLKKRRIEKKRQEIDQRIKAKKIIDELLEKISRSGINSLTPEEKARLEWARRNYYPDKNDTVH